MKAFILAAGRGSRLLTLTDDRPKCWVELQGRPLIEWQLNTLRRAGIDDITIVRGYLGETFDGLDAHLIENPDWDKTNMVESLFCAEQAFDEDIIVAYSDIVYEPRVLRNLLDSNAQIAVIVDRAWRKYWEFRFDDPLSDAESLTIDDNGLIVDIGGEVSSIEDIEAQYIGLMRFRRGGIAALRAARESMRTADRDWKTKRPFEKAYMTDLLMELVLTGHAVHPVPINSGWLEIDTVGDYEKTAKLFEDGNISRFFDARRCYGI